MIRWFLLFIFLLSGCGHKEENFLKRLQNKVETSQASNLADPIYNTSTFPQRSSIANGVSLIVTNKSRGVIYDNQLFLKIYDGESSVGSYYGNGIGSKIIIGFENFNKVKLSDFKKIEFDSKVVNTGSTSRNVSLNMVVDLNCDENNSLYNLITVESTVDQVDPLDSYSTININSEDIPELSLILSNHPDACLVNADILNDQMPKNLVLPSLMLVFGDSDFTYLSKIFLDNIKIITLKDGIQTQTEFNF